MKKKSYKTNNLFLSVLFSIPISILYFLKIIGDLLLSFSTTLLTLEYTFLRAVLRIQKKIFVHLLMNGKRTFQNLFRKKRIASSSASSHSLHTIYSSRHFRLILPKNPFLSTFFRIKGYFSSYSFYLSLLKMKYFLFGSLVVIIIAISFRLHGIVTALPNPNYLSLRDIPTTTKIYDRNGKLLYEYFAEENRTPIAIAQIPKYVIDATLAIEDKDFFNHQGISSRGILRAFLHNLNSPTLQGGSTITQQLVRSALLTPEKTVQRKIVEIVLAVWAERVYTKDQILEMYLNQVPYGGTAWGIEAAAQYYFGKDTKSLTLSEASLLAGLPAAPTLYSPFGDHPQFAITRQKEVLNKMVEAGFITRQEAETAKQQTLTFRTPVTPILAPHFVMYVRNLLNNYFGAEIVAHEGFRVTTSLDLSLQEMAENVISQQIDTLRPMRVGNAAALITNPQNGEILAMVGSANYFDIEKEGNVNLTTALRQPGSSIKVITYAEALNRGYTPATILYDTPVIYKVDDLPAYSPLNYDGAFHGPVTLRVALGSSYNVPAVKVLAQIGVKNMIEQGKRMGVTSWADENRFGLSLTLGGGDVTMLDMAKVYGTLASGGSRFDPRPILKITNWKGEPINLPDQNNPIQALSPQTAYLLTHILSDNYARTPAFGPNSSLVIPGKTVAVKTGTSDNKRDNWTIGYTQDFVTVTWVGNNDNSPMDPKLTSGVTGAAPIWNEIMKNLLKDMKNNPFPIPSGIITIPCHGRQEVFVKGTEPKGGCAPIPTYVPSPRPS
ncbi:penicillin-binding protein [Candidatus Gottesmanbacteria bacterium]|nr:penicillin-binding protein [Candidatus Gottesmanbacteria bacterium]